MKMKPMLAASMREDKGQTLDKLTYPLTISPKIDGIRCLIIDGKPVSRTLKPIPNLYVQEVLSDPALEGLDGELVVGDGEDFQANSSGIMKSTGEPDFVFHVFDWFRDPDLEYQERVRIYTEIIKDLHDVQTHPQIRAVPTCEIRTKSGVEAFTASCLELGYEGAMVRDPKGVYKFGRSTFNQGLLVKVKPFEDQEAKIIGFEEAMANNNEATKDALGKTKRSTAKENLSPKGTLGALVMSNDEFPEFNIGTGIGFNDELKQKIWDNQDEYLGKLVKFRFQRPGTLDKPRIPSFLGFRHQDDIS